MTETNLALFSVIIPNWNGRHFLKTCLDSLIAQSYPAVEIIVVDNASSDGSQTFIQDNYSQVKLIIMPENRGFTGACNAGMEAAQGEYIALLNNDTEVDPRWAAAIVYAFERHPDVGLVASKMLLFDRRDHIHTTGDYFTIDGQAGNRGVWQADIGQYEDETYVFAACGGSAAYRRSMLDEIGLLDDDFFFLLEDMDLAWRAQLRGWRCLYTPYAIVYHHLSATGGGVTASFYNGRNLIYLLAKNYPADLLKRHGWRVFLHQCRRAYKALRSWRGAAARAELRGMLAGLLGLPSMLRKRRVIQAARTITMDELEAILSPPINEDCQDYDEVKH